MEIITTKINTMKNKKVICIEDLYGYITAGETYEVIREVGGNYEMINDGGELDLFSVHYFKPVKNKSKKAKKIKALRLLFNAGTNAIQWCINIVGQKGNIPEPLTKMHSLHVIALEEVNKEKPSMKRVKFLISEMESLTQQTIKD